jgi:hypothetical protein
VRARDELREIVRRHLGTSRDWPSATPIAIE